ncbi:hypothetical protein Tco_0149005 [Tanacetum coccineum]
MSSYNHFGCERCGGPFNGGNCPGCSSVESRNEFVYDPNPYSYNETPNFFNQPPQHQYETYSCELCRDSPYYGFDCQTRTPLVYEQDPCSNQNFSNDQSPYYSTSLPQQFHYCEYCGGPHYGSDCQTGNVFYEHAPYDNHGSDEGYVEIDSVTEELLDALLMGDEVITTPARENDKFIKSSVDDLIPIPREFELTSNSNLECDMPVVTSLPTTDVREENFDINSPLGEYVVDFLMENKDIASLPRHLVKRLFSHLVKNPSSTKRMFDEPLGNDSKPRSYDVTFSNPLFDFNDDFTLCNDNLVFDEEFEDISSLDPPKTTPVIDDSTLLVTPPLASKQFSLREVERFDPFFSLMQSGGKTRVIETPSFGFHHMPITPSSCILTEGDDVSLLPSSPHIG